MNYWFWLLIILIPVIVFCVKPEASMWRRMARLLLAIAIGYVLANVALHWGRSQDWKAYQACQSQFEDGDIRHHRECPEIDIGDGASNAFYLLFGWIPAAAYVGFWELIWRRRYRHTIRAMCKTFKGKWASNALIIFSVPVWLYILAVVALTIYMAGCNWLYPNGDHWFSPNDKCWLGK